MTENTELTTALAMSADELSDGCVITAQLCSQPADAQLRFAAWQGANWSYLPPDNHAFEGWHSDEILLLGKPSCNLNRTNYMRVRRRLSQVRRLLLKWQLTEAIDLIDKIDQSLAGLPTKTAQPCRVKLSVLRATYWTLRDDSLSALYTAQQALKGGHCSAPAAIELMAVCQFSYWRLGDFEGLDSLPRHGHSSTPVKRRTMTHVLGLCVEASIELHQLRPEIAKRLALNARSLAGKAEGMGAALATFPASIVAQVLYEQGYRREAESCIAGQLPTVKDFGVLDCVMRTFWVLSRIARSDGQNAKASAVLQEAEALGVKRGWARLIAMSLSEQVDLSLRLGLLGQAQSIAGQLDAFAAQHQRRAGDGAESEVERFCRLANAQVALLSGRAAESVLPLRRLHDEAVARRDHYSALRMALKLAVAIKLMGDTQEAETIFIGALRIGRSSGLHQIFLDEDCESDSMLLRLCDPAQPRVISRDLLPYIDSLIVADNSSQRETRGVKAVVTPTTGLSSRERDILTLVSTGFSNKRIAQALTIAPETVKTHIRRIFLKLDVSTRAQAVCQAAAHGYIHADDGDTVEIQRHRSRSSAAFNHVGSLSE